MSEQEQTAQPEAWRLDVAPVGGWPTTLIVFLVLAVLLFQIRAKGAGSAIGRRRRLLSLLRCATLLLLLLALLRPQLVHPQKTKQQATLLVLVDQSRSMQVTDMAGRQTRWAALQASLAAASAQFAELAEDVEIRPYLFDAQTALTEISAGSLKLPQAPEGEETSLGHALEQILELEAGKRLLAVLVLSDGAQRAYAPLDPQIPVRGLVQSGVRLHAVPFGKDRAPGQTRDVAIEQLLADEQVFVKNPLAVSVTLRIDGFVNQDVPVQLLWESTSGEMEVVARATVRATQDGQRVPLVLEHTPQSPGEYKLTVRTEQQPGELVTLNNELSTFVTVRAGGLNVLYLEGAIRVEQKFIRRALDASQDLHLDLVRLDPQHPETAPADFLDRFAPKKYDVYLLGDVDAAGWTEEQQAALAQAVEAGSGLCMFGGFHSFGAGGYGRSPLAPVLPIQFDRLERQNYGEPIRGDLHWNMPLALRPTRAGEQQGLMRLAAASEDNAQAWAELPPLEGANRFAGLKPGAVVLGEGPGNEPLLVAKDYGAGRTLAFAGDSTWRWSLAGFDSAQRRFWRQIVLWLARRDQATEGRVWLRLASRRFLPGASVEFAVGAEDEDGEPVADAEFVVQCRQPDGILVPVRMRRSGQEWTGVFSEGRQAGDYTLLVEGTLAGESLGEAKARFLVTQQDLELDNPAADRQTLASLASMTQGSTVAPEQLPQLLADLQQQTDSLEVETLVKSELWDNPWLFLALVGVMCLEWFLRKKWGLA